MPPSQSPARLDSAEERRTRILDAAEACFVRHGFHRATMHDVAAEAGMSPGNLYRYFPSKDAIVAGLAERDRAAVAEDFSGIEAAPDLMQAFTGLARRHLAEAPAEKAVLCLEMWAEATRNPAMAAICRDFEREIAGRLSGLYRQAQARVPQPAPGADPEALARLAMVMADGIMVRRALSPDFATGPVIDAMLTVIGAALDGRFDPTTIPESDR
ncbi:TetR family transcriptional regulator [Methylobacterium indicum]|uniref:TetR/AcrR family transcriptional regulator n=1 Tax=Methylobacterium indicum TaxID=1775910 RepID=UPI000733D210|nr:TetR/AcrR family transcriptional regulator [Methylobacterium indicum]KTS39151.1 TetR family transcriptional regulator [Methylobacterium indicum]KTS39272.1 TetR family transcriptional regulator [Methylobacterium indicum]KTS54039.1 TetR family transcriptional regulator [Methylobacterium indicum]